MRQQNGTVIYRAKAETKMEEKEGWSEGKRRESEERRRRSKKWREERRNRSEKRMKRREAMSGA